MRWPRRWPQSDRVSLEINKQIVRRLVADVINGGDLEAFDELVAPDCVDLADESDPVGRDAYRDLLRDVSFQAEAEGGSLRLKACNVTGGPIDPDGAGGSNYNYIASADPAEAQAQPGGSSHLDAAGPLSSCRAECPSWPPTRSTNAPWRAPGD
jgi:hypothetical protein